MDNAKIGLLGLVTVLAIYGGGLTLTSNEAENTYYCSLTNEIAVFQRLSSTMKTGYYTLDGVEKSVSCRSGTSYAPWITLRVYAEQSDLNYEDIIASANNVIVDSVVVQGRQGEVDCDYSQGFIGKYTKCYKNGVFSNYAGELVCGD